MWAVGCAFLFVCLFWPDTLVQFIHFVSLCVAVFCSFISIAVSISLPACTSVCLYISLFMGVWVIYCLWLLSIVLLLVLVKVQCLEFLLGLHFGVEMLGDLSEDFTEGFGFSLSRLIPNESAHPCAAPVSISRLL